MIGLMVFAFGFTLTFLSIKIRRISGLCAGVPLTFVSLVLIRVELGDLWERLLRKRAALRAKARETILAPDAPGIISSANKLST